MLGSFWLLLRQEFIQSYPLSYFETLLAVIVMLSFFIMQIFSKILDFKGEILPTRSLNWSWKKGAHNFIRPLLYGTLFGIVMGVMAGITSYLKLEERCGATLGFLSGYVLALGAKVFFAEYFWVFNIIEIIIFPLLERAFATLRNILDVRLNFLMVLLNLTQELVKSTLKVFAWLASHIAFPAIFGGIVFAQAGSWGSRQNMGFWNPLKEGGINGVILGLTVGFILFSMTSWEEEKEIEPTLPNKGVRASLQHFVILTVTFSLCFSFFALILAAILLYLLQSSNATHHLNDIRLIAYGLSGSVGIFFGLMLGWTEAPIENATMFVRHFIVRCILWFDGTIPWNYARFLDYCTERLFLQRVGGRYRFVHKHLQDHFARINSPDSFSGGG